MIAGCKGGIRTLIHVQTGHGRKEFENIYNKIFFERKKKFYTNNSIHKESKFKTKTSNWMIERLLEIDLEDSINKFGFLNIINIHNKKFNLLEF